MKKRHVYTVGLAVIIVASCFIYKANINRSWLRVSPVEAQTSTWWEQNWAMAGANPQRTSRAVDLTKPENMEFGMKVHVDWFTVIEPYISLKVQPVAANNLVYVATSKGLYAIHTGDNPSYAKGTLAWVYPTDMPLGNAPTVTGDKLYAAGFDHKIHCIEANPIISQLPIDPETTYRLNNRTCAGWSDFEAAAGFDNELV